MDSVPSYMSGQFDKVDTGHINNVKICFELFIGKSNLDSVAFASDSIHLYFALRESV